MLGTTSRFFLVWAFALCGAASSAAADLPSRKAEAPPPPVFTWTGFYVGFNFGHAWTGSDPISVASANFFDLTAGGFGAASAFGASGVVPARLNGFFNGGQAGYNWQFAERLVVGVEADIQGAGVRGGGWLGNVVAAPGGFAVTSATLKRSLEYFGTVRGRLGYAVTPTILVYATGGLAYGGANAGATINQSLTPTTLLAHAAKGDVFENRFGWSIGAGAEMALSQNVSAKLEYLYYDLGSLTLTNRRLSPLAAADVATGAMAIANATNVTTKFNGHSLRAGLNYRFDWTVPANSGAAATPLFASPEFTGAERPSFGPWRLKLTPYMWAFNTNGSMTVRNHTVGTDVTLIDAIAKVSSFPLAFMGRIEARNGPVTFYGDLAWARLRFSGSTLKLRSPLADIAIAANAAGRLRETLAIGEAGAAYEFARWKLTGAPESATALDAYAGLRYWYMGLDLNLDVVGAVNSQLLDVEQIGAKAIARSGNIQWIDPVIGVGLRHMFSRSDEFQMRGDIGGFGVGSKFSWQFYGGYNHDFEFRGLNFTGTIGYRALSVDYATRYSGRENGLHTIIHGPVTGVALRF